MAAALIVGQLWAQDSGEDQVRAWAGELSLSAGVGYRENPLYSELLPQDSPFSYVSLEGVGQVDWLASGARLTGLIALDQRRYTGDDAIPGETFGLAIAELSRWVGIDGEIVGGLEYLYLDQAFDATFDIRDESLVQLAAEQPELYVRWSSFFWQFEYAVQLSVSRMYFADSSEDFETVDGRLELDYQLLAWDDAHLRWSIDGFQRDFTDRLGRDRVGGSLEGVFLSTQQVGSELSLVKGLDWLGQSLSGELGCRFEMRRDGQFGYYDRDRWRIFARTEGEGERWMWRIDLSYTDSSYGIQLADDGRLRWSDNWTGRFDLERFLGRRWSVFSRFEKEVERTNEDFASYESASVLLGVRYR